MFRLVVWTHFFLFIPHSLAVDFQQIYQQSILKNNELKNISLDQKINLLRLNTVESKLSPYLTTKISLVDQKETSLFSFQGQRTKYLSPSISIAKDFSWGGKLSFTHAYVDYDLSSWSASSRSSLPSEKPIDLSHTVSYTQDLGQNLFGKQYRLDLERAKVEITANRIQYSLEKQQTLIKLFQSYLKTMMMKSFHETSKDSLQRAQRRLSYLSRRYRDGISLRVEYLKAQNDYIAGEQRVQNDYHQMLEDLTELNLESQMNLNEQQIKSFLDKKLTNLIWYELPPVNISQLSNDKIELLEKKLQIYKMLEDKMHLSQKSSLSLNLSYEMSDLDNSWSKTFSESTPGSDHYNKSISLNWVLPLGENMAKVEYIKSKIEKQKQENNLNYAKKQVLENNKTLTIKTKNMLQLAKKLEQNINLAYETMQEQNRRFRKGQIDLEQVLTAEENYDVSLKSFVSHYYQYNLLLANLAINQDQFDYFMEEIAKRL